METQTQRQTVLFIGAGRMAEAIFAGLLRRADARIGEIIVSNRSDRERLAELQARYGVTVTQDWREQIGRSTAVVLAMPPGDHKAVLAELAPQIDGQFVITVAAGVGTQLLEASLPAGTPVAWVMPNTAAMIGESISLYTYGQAVREEHREILSLLLAGIGESAECTEQQIHELTAVTGSAPAFLYRFVEALEASAVSYGLSADTANKLVAQMVYGSAKMLKQGTPPAELRDGVTTPGGATAAGLRVLDERGYAEALQDAVTATNARAREMAEK